MVNRKIYVLDTNVLMHDPHAMFAFEKSLVGIPATVLEELDEFKQDTTDRGRNAREAIRQLDALRLRGCLGEGVELDNGAVVKVLFANAAEMIVLPFKMNVEDNRILLTALEYKAHGYEVIFISKDLNARVKADSLGIATNDYIKEHISRDNFYKGWVKIAVPSIQLKKEFPEGLEELAQQYRLTMNEFVLVESQHNPYNYRIFRYKGGNSFDPIFEPLFKWDLKPRNPQQLMALNLLLDDSIPFVTLFGPAGTGKTFLALLAGLHKVLVEDIYRKILISRPIVPLGRDIGYLPGTLEEKLQSWMLPIYDNIDFIVHAGQADYHRHQLEDEFHEHKHRRHNGSGKKRFFKQERHVDTTGLGPLQDLVRHDKLSLEAITYMRGRSIPYQFILIDEVQNLTPHEVKTLVSRVGEGSKIILAGDPYQIDSPYLDFSSNGLVVTSEKFKNQKLFGTVYLETSERSDLSRLAGDLL